MTASFMSDDSLVTVTRPRQPVHKEWSQTSFERSILARACANVGRGVPGHDDAPAAGGRPPGRGAVVREMGRCLQLIREGRVPS